MSAIPPSPPSTPTANAGAAVAGASANTAASVKQGKEVAAAQQSSAAAAKQQLNVSILEASAQVSLSSGNESLSLLFRSAIDQINEILAPELGPDAIQNAASQDNSPEATAERIVSLSTAFYDAYAAKRSGDDPEQVAKDFIELIRGGFEKGFGEARDILDGLGVFNGEVEKGVMKTHELVNQGYDDFLTAKLAALSEQAASSRPDKAGV